MKAIPAMRALLAILLASTGVGAAFAQTGAGHPEDMPEPQKIYSPYVDRTAADSNLAEGVYWGGYPPTHFVFHRCTAYDAKYFGIDVPDEVEMKPQQRACTSSIWYTP